MGVSRGRQVLVRMFHTAITLGISATLIFTDTDLRQSLERQKSLIYAIVFFIVLAATLVMYWTTCIIDPGYVPIEKTSCVESEEDEDDEVTLQSSKTLDNGIRLRKCGYCGIVQPLRAKHCEDCARCVYKFDHHCPWLDACIGEQNHKFFWLFLLFQSAIIIWTLIITWNAIMYKPDFEKWLTYNIVFVIDILILLFSGLVAVCLFLLHSYIMFANVTTWELTAHARITYLTPLEEANPFDEGCFKNIRHFLCRLRVQQWETLYNKWINKKSSRDHHIADQNQAYSPTGQSEKEAELSFV